MKQKITMADITTTPPKLGLHSVSVRYCIIGFEFNEPMKHAEFYQAISHGILRTTDDWDNVKFFDSLDWANEVRNYLVKSYPDYGWYVLICNAR